MTVKVIAKGKEYTLDSEIPMDINNQDVNILTKMRLRYSPEGINERIWIYIAKQDMEDYNNDVTDREYKRVCALANDSIAQIPFGTYLPYKLDGDNMPVCNIWECMAGGDAFVLQQKVAKHHQIQKEKESQKEVPEAPKVKAKRRSKANKETVEQKIQKLTKKIRVANKSLDKQKKFIDAAKVFNSKARGMVVQGELSDREVSIVRLVKTKIAKSAQERASQLRAEISKLMSERYELLNIIRTK